jgi:peptidyl-prolyl cis-trans isomerase B (cyclophilin B)
VLNRLALTVAMALACGLVLAACGDDDGTATDAATSASGPCEEVQAPPPKEDAKLPPPKADAPTASAVVFDTSCGSFTVSFDDRSPKTAASFQHLAEEGFYDGTVFHRVVPGFVIQGGDPLGTDPQRAGTGGPGYHVDEKPPADLSYTRGTVAMAKSEVEPPGRSGSQFYVVTGADAGLPPDYALVGEVTEGMDTVDAIDALGTPGADGPPTETVVVESAQAVGPQG